MEQVAIEYNNSREHPVNIAARELSAKFEQKFLNLTNALSSGLGANDPLPRAQIIKPKGPGKLKKAKTPKYGANYIGAPFVDAGSEQLRMMQEQMQAMQEELTRLRDADIKREAVGELQEHRYVLPLVVPLPLTLPLYYKKCYCDGLWNNNPGHRSEGC